jgi:hypothetical protein
VRLEAGPPGSRWYGGDDTAGLLEIAQLQRDRGTDDGILPVIGDREPAHPVHPVVAGAVIELPAGGGEVALELLVGTEHEMHRAGEHERRFALEIGERGVGGEADRGAAVEIADVVAADGMAGDRSP